MVLPTRVILVGPMGAGKSTVGRRLADRLGRGFIDMDDEIERRAGADIPWIFDVEGEQGFRDREQAVLEDLLQRERLVIATGGGAIMRPANRQLMAKSGEVVYLHASVAEQVRRTRRDNKRPLLSGQDRAKVLAELMVIRDPLYREIADIIVAADGGNATRLVAQIVDALAA